MVNPPNISFEKKLCGTVEKNVRISKYPHIRISHYREREINHRNRVIFKAEKHSLTSILEMAKQYSMKHLLMKLL